MRAPGFWTIGLEQGFLTNIGQVASTPGGKNGRQEVLRLMSGVFVVDITGSNEESSPSVVMRRALPQVQTASLDTVLVAGA